jgi:serine protease Do
MAAVLMATLAVALPLGAATKARSDQALTPRTFIDLAKKTRPAVVSIKINAELLEKIEQWKRDQQARPRAPRQQVIPPEKLDEMDVPDWLKEFFKNAPGIQMPNLPVPEEDMFRYPYGAGSGMIVRSDGYILTNRHVLYHPLLGDKMFKEGQITVVLTDGRKFTGDQVKLVATDQLSDVAVLKIDAKNLPTVQWGDSDALELGEWVMAIGDPLELTGSISEGIISGERRDVEIAGYPQLLQTTAIINPGNSGGPLINLDGEVVGINMAIASSTGRMWSGVGFAIPSNLAKAVSNDLIEHGHPVRGYIGIRMTDPDEFPALAAHEGYKGKNGVGVVEVYEGLPAAKAGLRPYDIIVEIDGKEVESNVSVQRLITAHKPGDKIEFKVFRGGKTETIAVTAGDWPTEEKLLALGGGRPSEKRSRKAAETEKAQPRGRVGLAVENYPDKAGAPDEEKGVVIREIRPGSAAAGAQPSLRVGDVITEVEKQRVRNTDDFKKIISDRLAKFDKSKSKEEGTLLLRIRRGSDTTLVFVPLASE